MHFAFPSDFSIALQTSDVIYTYGPHVIPYVKVGLNGKEIHHQWYHPDISDPTDQSIDSNTKPTTQVTWSDDTMPPDSSRSIIPSQPRDFQIVMDLTYRDGMGKSVSVVYKGASADSLTHTIRLEDGSKLHIQYRNLQLIDQPDFSNLPKTPLDYRNEVGPGLTLLEAQALA